MPDIYAYATIMITVEFGSLSAYESPGSVRSVGVGTIEGMKATSRAEGCQKLYAMLEHRPNNKSLFMI